jgi:membrane-associated protease RseP (regulator of RpoE activity)
MKRNSLVWALSSWLVLSLTGYAAAQPTKPGPRRDPIQIELERMQKEFDRIFGEGFQPDPRLLRAPGAPGVDWGGMRLDRVDTKTQEQLGLPASDGLKVNSVVPGSPADKAGAKQNDILVKLNGKAVPNDTDAFGKLLKEQKADAAMDVGVLRNGKEQTLKAATMPLALQQNAGRPELLMPRGPMIMRFDFAPLFPPDVNDFHGTDLEYNRKGNEFTAKFTKGELNISVKGKFDGGVARPSDITIQEGKESKTYHSLSDVPAQHRRTVQQLMHPGFNQRVPFPVLPGLRDFPDF